MDSLVYDALSAEVAGEGHEVLWASDGQEACDLTLARRPDLLLLEQALPVFDGFEVADILRGDPDVPKALPIVLVADHGVEPHRLERSGFSGIFPKTHGYFELREFLAAHIQPDAIVW